MKALGMIETIGLIGAIEATDTALKTADVQILNQHFVKGGIVTVELTGDVAAVRVAVEAGEEAARKLGVFVKSHVIARPGEMIGDMLEDKKEEIKIVEIKEEIEVEKVLEEETKEEIVSKIVKNNKNKK
ncbi:Carboxysome shell and ethanolamine utilization microcompartment protein CcmL/EutN [Cetobacterium ceti]|uniref:Carboxysome shell and ethanolamine utilization microcompartment protein CcmL/EutN n=1 Tax=Cetobacterium ceti TaxID=180163 RepID=A0A1T4MBL3_9FUSO|nr:BMC domain-containing protein [Cetobacterium ceti]SJZ64430.1 Carboxysome shell and ethanolamine utilization microcompartment protein CcmL/EutN [Cetobacterium ceti]